MSWERVKEAVRWLVDHWYLPLAALASVLGYMAGRTPTPPKERLQTELDAVAARRDVRRQAAIEGAEVAHARVAQMFAEHQDKLAQEDRDAAQKLLADPPALAAYLVRTGATLPDSAAPAVPGPEPAAKPKL